MAVYYVGPGGNDSNPGLNWGNRLLTLNAAEGKVSPGDIVYVGPGIYREQLTVDISGTSGNVIQYIADITGKNTDKLGGDVIISGSNDDTSGNRDYCIYASGKDYRQFTGFHLTGHRENGIHLISCDNWIIEDVRIGYPGYMPSGYSRCIYMDTICTNITVRRCYMVGYTGIYIAATDNNLNISIENCVIIVGYNGIYCSNVNGVSIYNCTIISWWTVVIFLSAPSGNSNVLSQCILLCGNGAVLSASTAIGTFSNCLYAGGTVAQAGTNCHNYLPLFKLPILTWGGSGQPIKSPTQMFPALSANSYAVQGGGSGGPSDDLFGRLRPTTTSKRSWGAIQYDYIEKETTITHSSSAASLKMADASRHQIFVPVQLQHLEFSVYVYREADYSGTLPQMIIRQPGEDPVTLTDTGASGQWNLLTDKVRIKYNYCVIELVSNNTASTGNYAVFFDSLEAKLA